MASKRPREQQPGVVDEMANAIVRQVKAQRIVVNKGPKYQCFIPCGEQLQKVLLWPAVVSEQRVDPRLLGRLRVRFHRYRLLLLCQDVYELLVATQDARCDQEYLLCYVEQVTHWSSEMRTVDVVVMVGA